MTIKQILFLILPLLLTVNCFSQIPKHIYVLNPVPVFDSLTNTKLKELGVNFHQIVYIDSIKINFKTYEELNSLMRYDWTKRLKNILYLTPTGKKFLKDSNKKFEHKSIVIPMSHEITFYSIGLMKTHKYHYYQGGDDAGTWYEGKLKYDKNGNETVVFKKEKRFNGWE